jgi:hypothetical protein
MKQLSRLFALVFLGLAMLTSSCGNDDGPEVSPIVGTWTYSSMNVVVTANGQPLAQFLQLIFNIPLVQAQELAAALADDVFPEEDFQNLSLEFRADGTYTIRESGAVTETGSYELLNGTTLLRLTSGTEITEFQVRTLTNNELALRIEDEESGDFLNIGLPILVRVQLNLDLVK